MGPLRTCVLAVAVVAAIAGVAGADEWGDRIERHLASARARTLAAVRESN